MLVLVFWGLFRNSVLFGLFPFFGTNWKSSSNSDNSDSESVERSTETLQFAFLPNLSSMTGEQSSFLRLIAGEPLMASMFSMILVVLLTETKIVAGELPLSSELDSTLCVVGGGVLQIDGRAGSLDLRGVSVGELGGDVIFSAMAFN